MRRVHGLLDALAGRPSNEIRTMVMIIRSVGWATNSNHYGVCGSGGKYLIPRHECMELIGACFGFCFDMPHLQYQHFASLMFN